ncbi:putative RNA-directed DNA polymerase [Tanacetum coccineum]
MKSRGFSAKFDETFMRLGDLSSDVADLQRMVRALIRDRKNKPSLRPRKAVEQCCVNCGGVGNNFNQGQIYRPPVHQPVVNQPVAHQGPAPQTHGVSKTDFERYVTANDAVLRNMQNQGQNLQSQMANLTDMLSKFVTANTASTSGSGNSSGNMFPKPKGDLKVITTRNVQPPVVQIQSRNQNPEPNVAPVVTPIPKASIPFPSRRNDEKRKEKANDQNEKFYEIFRDLRNNENERIGQETPLNEELVSSHPSKSYQRKLGGPWRFLIPCEFRELLQCYALADLGASINIMPYSVGMYLALPELPPTCLTLDKKKNYNNQKNKHKKDDDGDDSTEVNTTTDEFFVCSDYDMVNLAHDDSSWILDSGATCHVATRKEYFSSYTPGDFGVVRMGNTGLSRIAGIGDICLKFDTGMELVLHNVKHVPDMRLNIISTGLLDEDGYHNSSGNGLWKVTLGSLIVARGKRESKSIVNAIDNDDMTELWHKRLGHMSEKGMSILSKKNVLSGVHDINLKKCSHCLAGKMTRRAFKSRHSYRTGEHLIDFGTFRFCVEVPMKTKNLVGVRILSLSSMNIQVERQTGKKLKCIRSDNGGEYIGPFDAYCREHGILASKDSTKDTNN